MRQPARVAPARREPGERHALLEVEQVERQLGGGVPGGQRTHPGVDQVGLAGPGRPADQRVRRVVAERARSPLPVGSSPIGAISPRRRRLPPLPRRQQVSSATGAGPAATALRDRPAGGGDQRRPAAAASSRPAASPAPLERGAPVAGPTCHQSRRRRPRPRGRPADHQVHPAGRAGAQRAGPAARVPAGSARPRAAEQHRHPPRLGPRPVAARQLRAASACSPASTVSLIRRTWSTSSSSSAPSPPGPDERQQPAGASGAKPASPPPSCSGSYPVIRTVPGRVRAERAQQQAGDHVVAQARVAADHHVRRGPAAAPAPGFPVGGSRSRPTRTSGTGSAGPAGVGRQQPTGRRRRPAHRGGPPRPPRRPARPGPRGAARRSPAAARPVPLQASPSAGQRR